MTPPRSCISLNLPLETLRCTLRPLEPEDFQDIFTLCTHPDICRYIRPPMTRAQVETHIHDRRRPWLFEDGRWFSLAARLKGKPRILGELVFRIESMSDARAEIGYRFHPDAQGKGLASETVATLIAFLFRELRLHKLAAYCDPKNETSIKLLKRVGMLDEGYRREHIYVFDEWRDLQVFGMLAKDLPTGH